jgi:hypothetical protein
VPTLTREEVTIKREERWCSSCTKKEIMRLKKGSTNEGSWSVLLGLILSCDNSKTMT